MHILDIQVCRIVTEQCFHFFVKLNLLLFIRAGLNLLIQFIILFVAVVDKVLG